MQAKQIDTMERIYNKLSIKELKINQFTGQNDQTNLASIIPGLGFAMSQLKTVEWINLRLLNDTNDIDYLLDFDLFWFYIFWYKHYNSN